MSILSPLLVIIPPEASGERLDRFLAHQIPSLTRSRLKALMDQGHVRAAASGATITNAAQRVKPGERFEVTIPPAVEAAPVAQPIDLVVRYEDDDLIVIDKPVGLVVHPAPGSPDNTLVNALIAHCGHSLSGIGGVKRPGIVHRLDKDTSGLMVVAKNDATHTVLSRDFAERQIERAYLALAWGMPEPREGSIEGNIGRHPKDRKKMAVVSGGGKPATTDYRVIKPLGLAAALVECRLRTGRTHQIRVHMTHIGHPLLGDPVYGRLSPARRDAIPPSARALLASMKRQALHAFLLGFTHPRSGEFLRFDSPLPSDLTSLAEALVLPNKNR